MQSKNADMIDSNSNNNQELLDLKYLEARRKAWSGKKGTDIAALNNDKMLELLSNLVNEDNIENSERFEFQAMEDYKKHSFPKSTRLNVLPMAKLLYIEQASGKTFNALVLDMINTMYEQTRQEDRM
nr:hypothetical protein [Vibrio sp. 23023]